MAGGLVFNTHIVTMIGEKYYTYYMLKGIDSFIVDLIKIPCTIVRLCTLELVCPYWDWNFFYKSVNWEHKYYSKLKRKYETGT